MYLKDIIMGKIFLVNIQKYGYTNIYYGIMGIELMFGKG